MSEERSLRFAALGLAALVCAACAGNGADRAPAGWSEVEGSVEFFGPAELWEHINGAADAYLAYGFESLSYRELRDGERIVAVEVYSHATPLDAFGIFRMENEGEIRAFDPPVGAAVNLLAPYELRMLSGRDYVKLSAIDGDIDRDCATRLLPHLARGGSALPAEFDWLPTKGRRPGSERYTRSAFLGLKGLERCLAAEYGEATMFLMLPAEGETVTDLWTRLRKGNWTPVTEGGSELLMREIPYRGKVGLVASEQGLFGATGIEDERELVAALLEAAP